MLVPPDDVAADHVQPVIEPLFVRRHAWSAAFRFYGVSSNSAHAAFGGYKQSGIGRETHRMMLDHYQQTKNLLLSYSPKRLGFF
ncbi:aldehyde dehydrogenase family protein [Streptomyces sp. NPDC033753]|uniref:aldehyde dehydrogenase family protein n=1 Tax=Streptomyces sp. NPDC033753 TaxID=3155128 RepID=UPI0033FC3811